MEEEPYGEDPDRPPAARAEGESMLMLSGELEWRALPVLVVLPLEVFVWICARWFECELFPPPDMTLTPGAVTGEEEPALLPVAGTFIGGACGRRIP